jgi:hypothetical protein
MFKKLLFITLFFNTIYAQAEMSHNIAECADFSGFYVTQDAQAQIKEMTVTLTKDPNAFTYTFGKFGPIIADSAKHLLNGLEYTATCNKGTLNVEFIVSLRNEELNTVFTFKQINNNGDFLSSYETNTGHDSITWIKQ